MSKEIKRSELKDLVKGMLSEEIAKIKIKNRLNEINEQLNEIDGEEPMLVDTEIEFYPDQLVDKGVVPSKDAFNDYTLDGEVNGEYDYLEVGVDYEGDVHGEYRPETRYTSSGDVGDPAEYPETEFNIEKMFVKNQKTGQWEELVPEHPIMKVFPEMEKMFLVNNQERIEKEIENR